MTCFPGHFICFLSFGLASAASAGAGLGGFAVRIGGRVAPARPAIIGLLLAQLRWRSPGRELDRLCRAAGKRECSDDLCSAEWSPGIVLSDGPVALCSSKRGLRARAASDLQLPF